MVFWSITPHGRPPDLTRKSPQSIKGYTNLPIPEEIKRREEKTKEIPFNNQTGFKTKTEITA
jgi:hypothetical protein